MFNQKLRVMRTKSKDSVNRLFERSILFLLLLNLFIVSFQNYQNTGNKDKDVDIALHTEWNEVTESVSSQANPLIHTE